MLDRLMYLKVSCSGGCQVTLTLETGLATTRKDVVHSTHPDPDPGSTASAVPASGA